MDAKLKSSDDFLPQKRDHVSSSDNIPKANEVVALNQKFRTFYGHEVNGNITVMNFKGSFSKEQIQNISNTISKDLKKKMKDNKTKIMVSVGVKFDFGYKSSTHLTELGENCDIWSPFEYNPDEALLAKYNDPNMRAKSFDVYLIMMPTQGGCVGEYNDCLFDCIKTLTNGKIPEKINHPKKLKKFFGVDRKDCIDIESPKMIELEKLLGNCNLFIGGDHQYVSHQPNDRYYKYHINLKGKHFSPKHVPERQVLGFFHKEREPMIFQIDGDHVETYNGENLQTMTKAEWKLIKNKFVMIPKEEKKTLQETYDEFREGAQKLKDMTADKVYQINMFKTGCIKNTIKNLFNRFTYGIVEPDEIDEFEGRLLDSAGRGGLIIAKPYSGECWKYDFVSRYSSIMCSTKCIPMKKGRFITMTQEEMDEKVAKKFTPKYGIYNCKIHKSNTENDMYFGFIKWHEYTHEDIEIAIKLGLKIEMINKENNAYIYEKDALVPMNRIFGDYIAYCFDLKKQDAPFAKPLLTRLWGTLSEKTKHYRVVKGNDEPIMLDVNYNPQSFTRLSDNRFQIEYGDTGNTYVYNWARIGTFLTSMARNKMAKFLLPRKDDVVYCHTDGFILKRKLDTDATLKSDKSDFLPQKNGSRRTFYSDKEFANELHGLKYEGYNPNIVIVNAKDIKK
jgi:hypothetical protein